MSDLAIKIENLSKTYQLGIGGHADLRRTLQAQWRKWTRRHPAKEETFYALRDITFNVQRGEVLGIIGRNGAGKSTLLKILSRITPPTTGRIEINGRIASLLEVGTGFHPELTGRENIFMNGSLLGMTRAEIKQRFDEIVDFSGVEQFLDTPVKRYSSGMYVRLAFAVAAHLEPEILLIDEVLAVGDVAFQKKCLGKMNDVARSGRTVVFVSHDLGSIEDLCTRCLWLNNGQLQHTATPAQTIHQYLKSIDQIDNNFGKLRDGDQHIKFLNTSFFDINKNLVTHLKVGADYEILFELQNTLNTPLTQVRLDVAFKYGGNQRISWVSTVLEPYHFVLPANAITKLSLFLPKLALMPGIYTINLYLESEHGLSAFIDDAITIPIESGSFYPSHLLPEERLAKVLLEHSFRLHSSSH